VPRVARRLLGAGPSTQAATMAALAALVWAAVTWGAASFSSASHPRRRCCWHRHAGVRRRSRRPLRLRVSPPSTLPRPRVAAALAPRRWLPLGVTARRPEDAPRPLLARPTTLCAAPALPPSRSRRRALLEGQPPHRQLRPRSRRRCQQCPRLQPWQRARSHGRRGTCRCVSGCGRGCRRTCAPIPASRRRAPCACGRPVGAAPAPAAATIWA